MTVFFGVLKMLETNSHTFYVRIYQHGWIAVRKAVVLERLIFRSPHEFRPCNQWRIPGGHPRIVKIVVLRTRVTDTDTLFPN